MSRRSTLCLTLALSALVQACGAPESRPAEGPIADQIETSLANGKATYDHSEWGRLLAEGTRHGFVDYSFMQENRADLDRYLAGLEEANLAALDPQHLKALLLNAYNALTVRSILDNWGVSSIREIEGVWDTVSHRLGGFDLTLDQIEHNIVRPFFRDPRIHFAVNCASASCAPLPPWSFEGPELDAQLDELTNAFLSDEDNVRVEDGKLLLSSYFNWYGDDFVAAGWTPRAASIPAFVSLHTRSEVAEFLRTNPQPVIEFLDYDWSLNRAP